MFKIHSIFPFLNYLLSFVTLFAAGDSGFLSSLGSESGPPVEVADMGGDDDSGADAGADKVVEADGAAKEGEEVVGDKAKPVAAQPALPDLTKPLSAGAKKALGELKQADPAAWKELNSRIWSLNGLDKKISEHFDNGIDDAIALKTDVDAFLQAANLENLQEVRAELNDFRTTDAKIIKGDPSFINDLPAEAQEAIYKMMPNFLSDWQGKDNEGYQKYFGGLVVATLRDTNFQKNLELALWKLEEMGVDDPGVKKIHDLLSGNLKWITDLDTKAKAPVEPKKVTSADDPVAARERKVQEQELKLARTRVVSQFRQAFNPKMLTELKAIAAGADGKIPAQVNKAEVLLKAMNNLAKTLGLPVERKIDSYLANGDEEGAFKYLSSQVTNKRLTEAVTQAYRYLYKGSGTPRPAATTDKGAQPGADKGAEGFITINYDPKPSSIDFAKTDALAKQLGLTRQKLIGQNKAVLKNGKRVTWPRDAEAEA